VHSAPRTAKRGGIKFSVATLTVISGLSIGVVTSWAVLTELRTTPKPAMPAPIVTSAVEQPPAPSEAPALAEPSPLPARAVATEPVKTGSISAAPPIPQQEPVAAKTPESASRPLEAVVAVKAPEPEAQPREAVAAVSPPQPEAQPREPVAVDAVSARATMAKAEGDAYLAKAEAALRIGDLAVARLFFGRVAEAGDARGATGMARTYDERELKKLPVFGLKGERAEVERWQARARELTTKSAFARK
jgi:hypothetical protein